MAFVNGTAFLHETGHDRTDEHLDIWRAFSAYRDHVCVTFDLVLHGLNPNSSSLPFFDVDAETAVLLDVIATFAWLPPPTATPQGFPTSTFTTTPAGSPTPTLTPVSGMGTITGRVLADERAMVGLFTPDNWPVDSILANPDGTFSLTVPAGTYTIVADTYGVLGARGSVTVTAGNTTTKPTITLPAGDLDGDSAINQFDAMTIGMNYNTQYPETADLNNDGIINVLDLEILAKNYRKIGPIPWEG
jgi:hypothetical protein